MSRLLTCITLALLCVSTASAQWSARGDISLQTQAFTDNPTHQATQRNNSSAAANLELDVAIGDNANFAISPYFRIDQHDTERTHLDFREILYSYYQDTWELNAGVGKVFWGVTEASNIVDVINQKDSVEGFNSSEKLGQPMINANWFPDWGTVQLYVLPGFRERTFASRDGRPRTPFPIDTSNAQYESSDEENHLDFAARISLPIESWDFGFHAFRGTAREPTFRLNADGTAVVPYYYQMTQVGLDVQATLSNWLLKAEAVSRQGNQLPYHSVFVTGFEYSFYSLGDSNTDLGIVAEWLYDSRADESDNPFQNDALIGLRFALNDEQSTTALIGAMVDLDGGGQSISLEASRRIGNSFTIGLEALVWNARESDASLFQLHREDYAQLELSYHF